MVGSQIRKGGNNRNECDNSKVNLRVHFKSTILGCMGKFKSTLLGKMF